METLSIALYLLLGIALGAVLLYFILNSARVEKSKYDILQENHIRTSAELDHSQIEVERLKDLLQKSTDDINTATELITELREHLTISNSLIDRHKEKIEEKEELVLRTNESLVKAQEENRTLFGERTSLWEENKQLSERLGTLKEEIEALHKQSKEQFENLAHKIFEEKSSKFTLANQTGLKQILEPFQEKIIELKTKVSETYDLEAKQRFSLAEKVKELADLNQQISQDAKNLTRALKGESKTQGNWGEMILESILEKSGLVKGREYFMEYQLTDSDNKAIYSEFSGKKMRPDAVVMYPDQRSVIIDSKVSLTAFSEMVSELDPEEFEQKSKQHLASVKNHITQLAQKSYHDYSKSLDFVMMFIPNEAAYVAALQEDPQLWNFAYEKRILLLSPSNLITSLKLIEDLWKREHQNNNAIEIADRGAKLYDKFVLFLENLEKVGKNLETAQNNYQEAHKQLTSGNDNLIRQTQKMQELGIKNKRQIPQSLIDKSESEIDMNPKQTSKE